MTTLKFRAWEGRRVYPVIELSFYYQKYIGRVAILDFSVDSALNYTRELYTKVDDFRLEVSINGKKWKEVEK